MLRFTIQYLLWLMVVVGLGFGWAANYRENQRLKWERATIESRLFDAAHEWARDKGEAVEVPGLGYTIEATPTGSRTVPRVDRER